MRRRDRILAILFVLLVIALIKLGQQVYRFYAFSAERIEIGRLEEEVEESGYGVIATQLRADTLRRAIEAADERLRILRAELDRYERQVLRGPVTFAVESAYRQSLDRYNDEVNRRNAIYRQWRATVDANHGYVDRYNLLVDSIRRMASAMGEPYYPVLTPAEIASRREAASASP